MSDELHVYCKLEGYNEEYLRARTRAEVRLMRLEKKKRKKEKAHSEENKECTEEAEEAQKRENLLATCQ